MSRELFRYLVVLALAGWWGALTFYGLVVVPAGTELLGSQTQGLVTQQVTRTLNWTGVAVAVLLVSELRRTGTRSTWAAWIVFSLCQAALFAVHAWLSALLAPTDGGTVDRAWFYDVHRIYLLTTAVQWAIGPWLLWRIVQSGSRAARQADTR